MTGGQGPRLATLARMRARLASILLLTLVATGSAAAENRAAKNRVGKVTLRVAQVFPETGQALVLDKAAGEPYKIGLDLIGIGHCLVAQGQQAEAATYFRRAADVARSINDTALVRQAEEGLAQGRR